MAQPSRQREGGAPHAGPAIAQPQKSQSTPPVSREGPAGQSPPGQLHVRMSPAPVDRPPARPAAAAANAWSHKPTGAARDVQGRTWRGAHQGLDQSSPWSRDRSWWRSDPGFHGYGGLRPGFFFIPDIGYRSVPSGYERRQWRVGQLAPRWFWQYSIENYFYYGLPSPPYGCLWIWLDHDIALIDAEDGYIIDIVSGVW